MICGVRRSQVPRLYCIQLGLQYPKNSKIWLWLLPQPTLGNALVEVDKNWNISGLLSGFQLEKLFFIHTVRSYSHSTATAEFVTSIGLKKWDGFLTFSTEFPKKKPNIAQEKSESAEMWEILLIWGFWWHYKFSGGSYKFGGCRRMAVISNCVNEKEFFFNWNPEKRHESIQFLVLILFYQRRQEYTVLRPSLWIKEILTKPNL